MAHNVELSHFEMFESRDGRTMFYCPENRDAGWSDIKGLEMINRLVEGAKRRKWQRN